MDLDSVSFSQFCAGCSSCEAAYHVMDLIDRERAAESVREVEGRNFGSRYHLVIRERECVSAQTAAKLDTYLCAFCVHSFHKCGPAFHLFIRISSRNVVDPRVCLVCNILYFGNDHTDTAACSCAEVFQLVG